MFTAVNFYYFIYIFFEYIYIPVKQQVMLPTVGEADAKTHTVAT